MYTKRARPRVSGYTLLVIDVDNVCVFLYILHTSTHTDTSQRVYSVSVYTPWPGGARCRVRRFPSSFHCAPHVRHSWCLLRAAPQHYCCDLALNYHQKVSVLRFLCVYVCRRPINSPHTWFVRVCETQPIRSRMRYWMSNCQRAPSIAHTHTHIYV